MCESLQTKVTKTLTKLEIQEMLLFAGQLRGDTKPLSKILIQQFGSLAAVLRAPVQSWRYLSVVTQSDETTQSLANIKITDKSERALGLMTVDLRDDLIISGTQCISFKSLSHSRMIAIVAISHWK